MVTLRPELLRLPPPAVLGREVVCFDRVGSTQDEVRWRALAGAPEGLAVFAESQSAGRGRRGRTWHSPPGGGLWFSLLLRPPGGGQALPALPLAAGVALAHACRRAAGVQPALKWPNDLLWEGRKLGGVLAEAVAPPRGKPFVVLGVGLNADLDRRLLPPHLRGRVTSLAEAAGRPVDRAALARAALAELDAAYRELLARGFAGLRARWRELSCCLGVPVRVLAGRRRWTGRALDVDEEGALLLATPAGPVRVTAGAVSLRPAAPPARAFEPFAACEDNMVYNRCDTPPGIRPGAAAPPRAGTAKEGPRQAESGKRIRAAGEE